MAVLNTQPLVGQVDTHGYQYSDTGSARSAVYDNVHASGKRLWRSEHGEQYEHGLYLAYHLAQDLRYLHRTWPTSCLVPTPSKPSRSTTSGPDRQP